MMIKLYKRQPDGSLCYHEAWINGKTITEHWGLAGTKGDTREHEVQSRNHKTELGRILASARGNGFEEIDTEQKRRLIVEFAVDGMGTPDDLDKRARLETKLNNALGWTGLGDCDGGSIGSETMEVCCFVVDFAIAKSVVEAALANTEFSDFTRIYDEDGETG